MDENAIVVNNVTKQFRLQQDRAHSLKELVTRRDRNSGADRHTALDDVSFSIPKGSMYALVGHNGCGKSTLLRCIAGIYQPTSGSVDVDGRISTLLELGAGFHPDLTGRENVYMNATILGMNRKQIDAVYDEIVDFAGVRDFIDSPVKIYSSGMFVRLGFSVAVHVDPEILIIDEVIAVGDTEFQRRCFDHLYALRKRGVTIVVVTHGIGTVETMCDGAAWLDHGVLQMTGTGAEVAVAYMDKVNAQEKAKLQAAETVAPVIDPDANPDTPPPPAPAQVEDIRIDGVEFFNAEGQPTDVAFHHEPLTVRIGYETIRPVRNPVFGLAIFSSAQVNTTGTNTSIDEVELGTLSGRGHVDFTIDPLLLTPGDYNMTVAIADEFLQHHYDRHERAYRLTVRHGSHQTPAGLVSLTGDWSAST